MSSQLQLKASSNSDRQYVILRPIRKWMSWGVEQLTIFAKGNLQGIPTNKNYSRMVANRNISSVSLLQYCGFHLGCFFLPSYLALQTTATNKFGNCLHFSCSFCGTQLFCDTLSSDPKILSLAQDAKGFLCVLLWWKDWKKV